MQSDHGGNAIEQWPPIAGFWIRLLAQIIDGLIWAVAVTVVGVILVALAPDRFGLAKPIWQARFCEALQVIPSSAPAIEGLNPQVAFRCRRSFFGLKLADEIILVEKRQPPNATGTYSVAYEVDDQLRPKQVFNIDGPLWLLFCLYIIVAQGRFGATLGKRAFRLRVLGLGGRPPGYRAALIRNVVLNMPGFIFLVGLLAIVPAGGFFNNLTLFFWVGGLCVFLAFVIAVNVWWTATHERPSIHDRLAGTRVVRLPRR
jgi:uncharacterized RDD family membrane protein YckC